jgi:hypothetical protein
MPKLFHTPTIIAACSTRRDAVAPQPALVPIMNAVLLQILQARPQAAQHFPAKSGSSVLLVTTKLDVQRKVDCQNYHILLYVVIQADPAKLAFAAGPDRRVP